jgi:Histidine kinase-like ATPase domain
MRRWLAGLLPPCPERDDLITVADELASNAIRHTFSGQGGQFTVNVTWFRQAVRVAVTDGGAPDGPLFSNDPDGEHGRGLLIVRGLSVRSGVRGDHRGRLVWADVGWNDSSTTTTSAPPATDTDETAIRDGEAALARRFAGTPAWFGRATLAWWALAGPAELISAPTARELAQLLSGQGRRDTRARTPAHTDDLSQGEDRHDSGDRRRTAIRPIN